MKTIFSNDGNSVSTDPGCSNSPASIARDTYRDTYSDTFSEGATYPLAVVAELIGEAARAAILIALLDGRARTAGELAMIANISAQSASGHLSKLVDGGLLRVQSSGRHRYYSVAGADVAHAIETLGSIATRPVSRASRSDAAGTISRRMNAEIYVARSCYDHLAGRVAVEMTRALEEQEVIRAVGEREYELGRDGRRWFVELGVDVDSLRQTRRAFARRCLDWTERRPHLAGALGAAMFSRMLQVGWIARRRETRVVRITHVGAKQLPERLGIVAG
jgi:DNA-binding transcriptional ArsR family regulator